MQVALALVALILLC